MAEPSQASNLAIVQALHAAKGGIAEAARESGALAEDVEWHVAGPPEVLPFAGIWHGLDGIAEFQRRLAETLRYERIELRQYVVGKDEVAAVFLGEGVAQRTGRPFRSEFLRLYSFRDGAIVRVRNYYDTANYAQAVLGADLRVAHLITPRSEDRLTREVTILLAQLRGFARGADAYPASALIAMLARCFHWMSDIVAHHGGTIDRAAGDCMTVAFESRTSPHDGARRAAGCAVDMQLAMREINAIHGSAELPEIHFGIGLNTGQVLSPALAGGDVRESYAIIGRDVDLASRIQAIALRGQVLMSASTFERCGGFVQAGEPIEAFVKGQAKLVQLRELVAIPSLAKVVPRRDNRRSPRAEVALACKYRMVVNGVLVPEAREGRILDIGYQGALIEIGLPVSAQSEIEVELRLPASSTRMTLRGRLIKVVPHDASFHAGVEFRDVTPEQQGEIQLFVQAAVQG